MERHFSKTIVDQFNNLNRPKKSLRNIDLIEPESIVRVEVIKSTEGENSGISLVVVSDQKTQDALVKYLDNRYFMRGVVKAVKIDQKDISREFFRFISVYHRTTPLNFKNAVNYELEKMSPHLSFEIPFMVMSEEYDHVNHPFVPQEYSGKQYGNMVNSGFGNAPFGMKTHKIYEHIPMKTNASPKVYVNHGKKRAAEEDFHEVVYEERNGRPSGPYVKTFKREAQEIRMGHMNRGNTRGYRKIQRGGFRNGYNQLC